MEVDNTSKSLSEFQNLHVFGIRVHYLFDESKPKDDLRFALEVIRKCYSHSESHSLAALHPLIHIDVVHEDIFVVQVHQVYAFLSPLMR